MDKLTENLLKIKDLLEKAENPDLYRVHVKGVKITDKNHVYGPAPLKEINEKFGPTQHIEKTHLIVPHKPNLSKSMNNVGVGGAGKIKAGAVLPSINKMPKPGHVSQAGKTGIPGQASVSTKNPVKSAEQTHNKDIKDIKMKEAQAQLAMQKCEEVKIAKNGQWSLEELDKSGYKGYKPEDNARRKANNTGETTGIHTMDSIKQYGGSGPSAAAREAKEMRAKSKKNPVREYTKEEIAEMNKPKEIEPTEKTEGRTTAVPGVSDMGIEVRRSNPSSKEYARVSSPEKHNKVAKEIAKENIKQTKNIKPKLPN